LQLIRRVLLPLLPAPQPTQPLRQALAKAEVAETALAELAELAELALTEDKPAAFMQAVLRPSRPKTAGSVTWP